MEDLNVLRQTLNERLLECYENRKAFWEQLDALDLTVSRSIRFHIICRRSSSMTVSEPYAEIQ